MTGDRLLVGRSAAGEPRATPIGAVSGGGASMASMRDKRYVFPFSVRGLIGTTLDPDLFETTALAALPGGRMPVTVTYADTAPPGTAVPGVDVSSRTGATGTGAITAASALEFGRALRTDDAKTLLRHVTRIAPATEREATAPARAPLQTVTLRLIGRDGQPADGQVWYVNTSDASVDADRVTVEDGVATVSIPAGTYQLLTQSSDAALSEHYLAASEDYTVSGPRTMTVDLRTATTQVRIVTDKVLAADATQETHLQRTIESPGFSLSLSLSTLTPHSAKVLLSPTTGTLRGTQGLVVGLSGASPEGTAERYRVLVGGHREGRIGTDPIIERAHSGTMAAYITRLHGPDLRDSRFAMAIQGQWGGFTWGERGLNSRAFTMYVTATEGWGSWGEFVQRSGPQFGLVKGPFDARELTQPAGSRTTLRWGAAPLHNSFMTTPLGLDRLVPCSICIVDGRLSLSQFPFSDNEPRLLGFPDIVNYRTRNGYVVKADDRVLASSDAADLNFSRSLPAGTRVITSIQVATRRGHPYPAPSTLRTVLTTPVAAGIARPPGFDCSSGIDCRVLPFLSVTYDAPVTLTNVLPPGQRTIAVTVNQVGRASAVGVRSVKAWVRYDGSTWTAVPVTGSGPDRRFTLTVPRAGSGPRAAGLRISVTDAAGSTLTETNTGAFMLAR